MIPVIALLAKVKNIPIVFVIVWAALVKNFAFPITTLMSSKLPSFILLNSEDTASEKIFLTISLPAVFKNFKQLCWILSCSAESNPSIAVSPLKTKATLEVNIGSSQEVLLFFESILKLLRLLIALPINPISSTMETILPVIDEVSGLLGLAFSNSKIIAPALSMMEMDFVIKVA